MHSISSLLAHALMDAVGVGKDHFADPNTILRGSTSTLSGSDQQIPLQKLNEFLCLVTKRNGNDDIGLLAYQRAHPGNLGVLGYAIMSSPTIHEALKCIIDFYPTVCTGFCIYIEEQPTRLRFVGVSADSSSPPLPRVFIDAIASITLGLLHWLTPSVRILPTVAEFTYRKPQDTQQLESLFGLNLVFSAPVNALTFCRNDTDLPVATFDASLRKIHNDYLRKKTSELTSDGISTRVKRIVLQRLHQAKPLIIADVAQAMSLSVYQLNRALDADGGGFQKLVDLVRFQHCHYLLMNTGLTLKQVSYSLGFKSQSALNKACERWFGLSPGRYRLSGKSSMSPASD